jgi:hypothetical protein
MTMILFRRISRAASCAILICLSATTISRAASTPASWVSAVSGNWTAASDWSTNPAFPNNNGSTTYAAQIAATGASYDVTVSSSITVSSLTLNSSNAELLVNGGTLNVAGPLEVQSGTILLANGSSIVDATLSQSSGSTLFMEGTLQDVTLGSNVTFTGEENTSISQGLSGTRPICIPKEVSRSSRNQPASP